MVQITGTSLYFIAATFCNSGGMCEAASELAVRYEFLYPNQPEIVVAIECDFFASKLRDRYVYLGGEESPVSSRHYPVMSEWKITSSYCERVLPFEARHFEGESR